MKKTITLLVAFAMVIATTFNSYAKEKHQAHLAFFWGEGCPHCKAAKPFMKELEEKYPELTVHSFETWKDRKNAELFQEVAKAYGVEARGVPAFFMGDASKSGYSDNMKQTFTEMVEKCIEEGCENPLDKIAGSAAAAGLYSSQASSDFKLKLMNLMKQANNKDTVMYFFWGDGCPHCAAAKPFLKKLGRKYPKLDIRMVETWKNQEGIKTFGAISKAYNVEPRGVPAFFIGDNEPIFGFADSMKSRLTDKIEECLAKGCTNPAVKAGLE